MSDWHEIFDHLMRRPVCYEGLSESVLSSDPASDLSIWTRRWNELMRKQRDIKAHD